MIIMITNVCNMTCEHCCFACTEEGEYMTKEIFLKALQLGLNRNVSIMGGEPTLHPKLWEFLCIAMASGADVRVGTNGLLEKEAITLASMARHGLIRCQLSIDKYHRVISPKVVRAFKEGLHHQIQGDKRTIMTNYTMAASGRATKFGLPVCCCDDIFVLPDGDVYGCGCFKHRFGNVLTGYEIPDWYDWECTNGRSWYTK